MSPKVQIAYGRHCTNTNESRTFPPSDSGLIKCYTWKRSAFVEIISSIKH